MNEILIKNHEPLSRLDYLGGSDAAAICGLSKWKTKLTLWMEKTERIPLEDISNENHIKFGNYMEDGVALWFQDESGKVVVNQDNFIQHPKYPWLAGNVDRRILGENAILECKTALNDDGWGDGVNIIPPYYLMQVAHYCAIGNFDKAYIAVVFSGKREMRWYEYARNIALEEKLIAREIEFWEHNIKGDVAPDPVNVNDILAFYKAAKHDPIIASEGMLQRIKDMKELDREIKAKTDEFNELKESVQLHMLDHDTLLAPGGGAPIVTWNYTKPIESFNKKQLAIDHPDLYNSYIKKEDPRRQFLIKIK